MPPRPRGTAVIQKRLGAELRRIREARGLRLDDVADELQVSPSTVSRIETGHTVPKVWEVRALAEFYATGPDAAAELVEWAGALKEGGWWRPIAKSLQADIQYLVSLESESTEIRNLCVPAIYGLLQAPLYARELFRAMLPDATDSRIDELVELRMRRQEIVTRSDDPVRLHVIADEACLHRPMGSAETTREQLGVLLERAALPNVTLQVLGHHQPFHRGAVTGFTVFIPRLPDVDPEVVSLERLDQEVFEEANVDLYQAAFTSLSRHAMDPTASRELIDHIRSGRSPAAPRESGKGQQ
ncbi:MAG: helix-turn-helix domain-containing protein [Pseudonocardia sp.]